MLSAAAVNLLAMLAAEARSMNPLEALASAAGVANIVLLVRRSIWNYPFGILSVALYVKVMADARLYSDALLQMCFVAIQLYGWWAWTHAGEVAGGVAVARLSAAVRIAWLVLILLVSALWGFAMASGTNAASPYWDGAIAVTSIAAQILLARRRIENWPLWIAVDVAAVGLYWTKGLVLTSALYVLYLVLSAMGLAEWRRVLARGRAAP